MSVDDSLDRALALLISSTKRRNRHVSLIEVGEALETAKSHLGTLSAVGERIGLSGKMLGQFSKVNQLCEEVRDLVADRTIDSVDMVAHLARLNDKDQAEVSSRCVSDRWGTNDVRAFVELRKNNPISSSQEIGDKVFSSKTKHEFAFEFVRRGASDVDSIKANLEKYLPRDAIKSVEIHGSKGIVVVDSSGHDAMKREAKVRNVPIRNLLPIILYRS